MSGTNGDKSRFNRLRKHRVEQRIRIRELQKSMEQAKPAPASSTAKPKVPVA